MAAPRLRLASLDEASLDKLRVLEQEFGSCILALEPQYPLAALPPAKLQQLQDLERELGVVLIAYQAE